MRRTMKYLMLLTLAAMFLAGCGADTSTSTQPTKDEIQKGIDRRIADVDKMNIPEAAKERMRLQIRGPHGQIPKAR
jgi:PBP1b-binding outer membrane lipoprotein LpoB